MGMLDAKSNLSGGASHMTSIHPILEHFWKYFVLQQNFQSMKLDFSMFNEVNAINFETASLMIG